jgi:hypothetical protein
VGGDVAPVCSAGLVHRPADNGTGEVVVRVVAASALQCGLFAVASDAARYQSAGAPVSRA